VSTTEEIRLQVREIAAAMSPLGKRTVQSSDRLVEDLGYDSLAIVELSLQIESRLGLTALAQDDGADVVTVADIEELVMRSAPGGIAGTPPARVAAP
jgi:acyl carrier protein